MGMHKEKINELKLGNYNFVNKNEKKLKCTKIIFEIENLKRTLKEKINFNKKYKNIIKFKKIYSYKNFFILALVFILLSIQTSLSNEKILKLRKLESISEITITIVGKGDQYILNNNNVEIDNHQYIFSSQPDQILINGIIQNYKGFMVYNLEKEENIITMKFNNFLKECNAMFYNLSNIIKIDLSKFDSSKVTGMAAMFSFCNSLVSINFNNFNTSLVTNMNRMFNNCTSLISLNLDSFNTSLVTNMFGTFSFCSSLKTINLKSFNTSSVNVMTAMFHGCSSLLSLELKNFDTSSVSNMHGIFKYCSSLISLDIDNFNTSSVDNMNQMFYGCNSLISLNLKNFITSSVKRVNKMFIETNKKTILCINENETPEIILDLKSFNENYINDCSNTCFTKSDKKFIIEKNICINNCYNDDIFQYEYENICFESCPSNTIISTKNNYLCEIDISLLPNWNILKFFNGTYNIDNINSTIKDEIINKIRDDIINRKINLTNLIDGDKEDLIVKKDNIYHQITSTENQKNKVYDDISTIHLGECEDILKKIYNIDKNLPLIIYKIDYYVPGVMIPVIGYNIFHPTNNTKLDLKYCKDYIINFNIPVDIDEDNLFKYDPNSEYYTDECFPYTTNNGTDILLSDRHEEYNNNNMSLCEKDCKYSEYETETKKVKCDCEIKTEEFNISGIENKNILSTNNFVSQSFSANVISVKCYYTLFTKEGISKNIGNYIMAFILICFIILLILFYKVGYPLLLNNIKEIIETEEKKKINNNTNTNFNENIINSNNINSNNVNIYSKNDFNPKKRKSEKKLKRYKLQKSSKKISIFSQKDISSSIKKSKSIFDSQYENNIKLNNFKNKEVSKNKYNPQLLNDFELNSLSYKEAIKYDKRTFFQYYISLLRTKQPIIFSFFPINDYNSSIIKISLFLLLFTIIYIVNSFFFKDSVIHKIYKDEGVYNFIYFLPIIIYSFLISHILYIVIKYFSLSERNLLQIKYFYKDEDKVNKIKRTLIIKYSCYFLISLIFIIYFWYYLSSFGAVFKNSQIFLVKNALLTFSISLLYPFFIIILPCIIRIKALNDINKKRELIYKISKIIQII